MSDTNLFPARIFNFKVLITFFVRILRHIRVFLKIIIVLFQGCINQIMVRSFAFDTSSLNTTF